MSESLSPAPPAAPATGPQAEFVPGWLRLMLIVAAIIEALQALPALSVFFGDLNDVPGPGFGGMLIAITIAAKALLALAAIMAAIKHQIRGAILAMACIVLASWLSDLPSLTKQDMAFKGGIYINAYMLYRIIACPFIVAISGTLAIKNERLKFAAILACLPTFIGLLGIFAFAIGIAIYGF